MYLFNPPEEALHDREAISYVAKTINILWIRSKDTNTTTTDSSIWADEQRLHTHLLNLTGQDPTNPTTNPMNFILPAYETMWRAVLRGLLEIHFRNATDSPLWRQILQDFMNNPTRETFRGNDSTTTLCALDIVKVILRMYPLTRRVNRRFPDDPPNLTRSADIEKCHRNALLVPTGDASVFRPTRWLEIKRDFQDVRAASEEEPRINKKKIEYELRTKKTKTEHKLSDFGEELRFMPFALSCPAGGRVTQSFGFKMVGLLVIALCGGFERLITLTLRDRLVFAIDPELVASPVDMEHETLSRHSPPEPQKWKLQAESPKDELPVLGTALKSERSDYLSLVYRRVV